TTYYLAPEGKGSDKPYALLRKAMQESGKVAVATLVMRNKEYLVAIRPEGEALALETMYFADEVRSPGRDLPDLPDASDLSTKEVSMAQLLIESMESEWDPENFHDTHREAVESLVEQKRAGQEIVIEAAPKPAKVVDLFEALSASVAAAADRGEKAKTTKSTKSATKATAKKAPAKKATAAAKPRAASAAKKASKAPAKKSAGTKATPARKAS